MVRIPLLSRRSAAEPTRDENRDGRIDEHDLPADGAPPTGPVVTDRDPDRTTYRSQAAVDRDHDGRVDSHPADPYTTPVPDPDRTDGHRIDDHRIDDHRLDGGDGHRAAGVGTLAAGTHAGGTRTPADRIDNELEQTADVAPARDSRTATGTRDDAPGTTVDPDVDPTPDQEPPVVPVGPRPRASLLSTLGLIVGVAAALFAVSGSLAGYGIVLGVLAVLLAFGGVSATRRRHVAGRSEALFALLLGLAAVLAGIIALSGQFDWPNTDGDAVVRFREWLDAQFVDLF